MAELQPAGDPARGSRVAVGARAAYDAVAGAYDRQFGDELGGKPLDRALLTGLVELVGRGRSRMSAAVQGTSLAFWPSSIQTWSVSTCHRA